MRRAAGLNALLFGLVAIMVVGASSAQEAAPPGDRRGGQQQRPASALPEQRLPADAVSQHTLELPGRTLTFTATAGAMPLRTDDGRLLAEIGYVAYTMPGADKTRRPVTFAFNGGPGSASAWLHLGALGPWRLPLDSTLPSPSAPPVVTANAETLLEFTDLVFIDPVGTGFSRVARATQPTPAGAAATTPARPGGTAAPVPIPVPGTTPTPATPPAAPAPAATPPGRDAGNREGGGARYFWSVNGDVESVAEFIRDWIAKNGRQTSPKVVIGESYGGIRAPKVVNALQTRFGTGTSALILLSPVIDYGIRGSWRGTSPMGLVSVLPSLAASAIELKDPAATLDRAQMLGVETYAQGDYLADLLRGPRDPAAVERLIKRVAELTGLPEAMVRQHAGRIDSGTWRRAANRQSGQLASIYDSAVKSYDPDPTSSTPTTGEDAFTTGYAAPMTSAMSELYATRLGWRPDTTYALTNRDTLRQWIYPNSAFPLDASGDLRAILAQDPKLQVLVAHGFTDTITPYFGSQLTLSQLPAYGDPDRLKLVVYPGGHMFYSRERSRKAFRDDVARILERTHP